MGVSGCLGIPRNPFNPLVGDGSFVICRQSCDGTILIFRDTINNIFTTRLVYRRGGFLYEFLQDHSRRFTKKEGVFDVPNKSRKL